MSGEKNFETMEEGQTEQRGANRHYKELSGEGACDTVVADDGKHHMGLHTGLEDCKSQVRVDNIIDGLIGACAEQKSEVNQLRADLSSLYSTIFDEGPPEMDEPQTFNGTSNPKTIPLDPKPLRRGLIGVRDEQRRLSKQIEMAAFVLQDIRQRLDDEEGYRT